MADLTPQQEKFCRAYAIEPNATKAALEAGYSKNSAGQQASRLLKKVKIQNRIATLCKQATERAELDLDAVLKEAALIAFSDIGSICTWTKKKITMKASKDLSPDELKCIESVMETTSKDGKPQLRVKMHSKIRAMEILERIFGSKSIEERIAALEAEAMRRK